MPPNPNLIKSHEFSSHHRLSILKSKYCGCFYCLKIFRPGEIQEWCDINVDGINQTALCPFCGIDSVLADFDVKITLELLKEMNEHWFNI